MQKLSVIGFLFLTISAATSVCSQQHPVTWNMRVLKNKSYQINTNEKLAGRRFRAIKKLAAEIKSDQNKKGAKSLQLLAKL